MTDVPGHLNASDLIDECARAMREGEIARDPRHGEGMSSWNDLDEYQQVYRDLVGDVLSVLRKRGLVTGQCLSLIKESEEKRK